MPRILIVDDDAKIARIIARYLEQAGFTASIALNGGLALTALRESRFDLLILDVLLPDTTGLTICQVLRQAAGDDNPAMATPAGVPVLMLSALGLTDDIVGGLRCGADDYLVKPFEPRELVERVRALLRRHQREELPDVCRVGNLLLDVTARSARCEGHTVELTRREYDLLAWLAARPGRSFSRDQLLDGVWGCDFAGSDRAVDLCVLRLRSRLEAAGWVGARIDTVWGSGYRLTVLPAEQP